MSSRISRRRVLRGMLGGAAISVGLPLLDCFLNDNGTALADGAPLPVVFGTWFAAMGYNPGFWEPQVVGPKYAMKPLLQVLQPFQDKINVFSGMQTFLDGRPLATHETGAQICTIGSIPVGQDSDVASIDQVVANSIGTRTRFRSLEVSYEGVPSSWSRRSSTSVNASEVSPLALYRRIFGASFADPNSDQFTPDPAVMLEKSVLSSVTDQRESLAKSLGAADRVRLDEYFTSLREFEHQLDVQLQKPMPMVGCTKPTAPPDGPHGQSIELVMSNGKLFAALIAHALACGQTRVFNAVVTMGASSVHKTGSEATFHIDTHEEPVDAKLGYQPEVTWYMQRCLDCLADMLSALDGVREGPRTLLDRVALYCATDHGYARLHTLTNIPLLTAGGANGRLKTGYHLTAPGDTVARVGLTVMQALQLPVSSWGTMSNHTTKPFSELLA
ncbi:MAG TPA: DUF1552 domain-containing protein [Steroidobacteraceae bacterium]|nr:DUF1552 domain-containing protein [Steroidobacteraceae bacterium]